MENTGNNRPHQWKPKCRYKISKGLHHKEINYPLVLQGILCQSNDRVNGEMNAILVGPRRQAGITDGVIPLARSNRNWHRS